MKTWNETREVLEAARACRAADIPCAIVILTQVKGSAFRRPGAKLLIRADGSMTGNVSGGCLENDLRDRALGCMAEGRAETVHYNTGSDEDVIWGLGLGCDGELDLLILPVSDAAWIENVLTLMDAHEPIELAWPLSPGVASPPEVVRSLRERARDDAPGGSAPPDRFIDPLDPPPDLVIIGAGDDAIPLAHLARINGFRVTVADHRSGYLTTERFPDATLVHTRPESAGDRLPADERTMAVIKNHALEMDKQWAAFYDQTDVRYIGLLGPKKRCGQIREQMTSGRMDRIFGPAGLDIGSEGAEQIAVSIIAQLLAVWSDRTPAHLHQREGPIHTR